MSETIMLVLPWEIEHTGGVNHALNNFLEQIVRHSNKSAFVLESRWVHHRPMWKQHGGYDIAGMRMRAPWIRNSGLRNLCAFLLYLPQTICRLRRIVRAKNVVCIASNYPGLSSFNFVVLRWLGLYRGRIVLHFHGTDAETLAEAAGVERWLWRTLISKVDANLACSGNLRDKVAAIAPLAAPRCHTVHYGIDLEGLERSAVIAADHSYLTKRRYIIHCGTFIRRKGHDVLVRAFAKLAHRYPEVTLVLVGDVGPANEPIADLIAELNLKERVVMLRLVPHAEVLGLIRLAEILVLPSRYEAFGLVLLEAGVFSRPVIASAIGGIPEIVTDNVDGLLVPVEAEDELAQKIADLLESPGERTRLGENLRRRVNTEFTWNAVTQRYLDHLIPGTSENGV